MDVKKDKQIQSKEKMLPFAGGVLCILLGLFIWHEFNNGVSVDRSDILLSKVKQGDLRVEIEGYGNLRSDKKLLLTSLTSATVQEIVLKPGAVVAKGSVIVRLTNPEVQQRVDRAALELSKSKAHLRELKLNHKIATLDENAALTEMEALYETAKAKLEAQSSLIKYDMVSELDYNESLVRVAQLKKRLKFQKERVATLKLVNDDSVSLQQEQIKQQQFELDIARNQFDKLTVKAEFDGVLQSLSVDLGQRLEAGEEIALIGSVQELIALVRVPQGKAQQISIGQEAIVDTRRDKIIGSVSRIDPVVVENTVEVEIALPKSLPASARPQLSIAAVIITETLTNITFIERPVNGKANSTISLFLVDESSDTAEKTLVKFGQEAGRYIEIVEGGKVDDTFIISDLSALKKTKLIISNI